MNVETLRANIAGNLFSLKVNEVTVTLNVNDHSIWTTPESKSISSSVSVIRTQIAE